MWEVITKGGPIVYLIIFCSFVAVAVLVEKLLYLYQERIDSRKFMEAITNTLKKNKIMQAIELCNETPGALARILKTGILKHDRPRQEIKEAIEDAGLHEIPKLEKNLSALATIAHICPLLGLLGTVTGMVKAFQVIQEKATALAPVSPGDLAGGIWEALITTAVGLTVAIPTFVAYNYLVSRVNSLVLDIERSATELVNLLTQGSLEY